MYLTRIDCYVDYRIKKGSFSLLTLLASNVIDTRYKA